MLSHRAPFRIPEAVLEAGTHYNIFSFFIEFTMGFSELVNHSELSLRHGLSFDQRVLLSPLVVFDRVVAFFDGTQPWLSHVHG